MKAGWSSASWKWLKSGYLVSPRLSAANLTRVHVDLVGTCTRGDALDTKKSFSPPGCRGQHGWVSKTITLEDAVSHRHQSEADLPGVVSGSNSPMAPGCFTGRRL